MTPENASLRRTARAVAALILTAAMGCEAEPPRRTGGPAAGWPIYAGDAGGSRYSPLAEIRPDNVSALEVAWTYRTGDLVDEVTRRRNHSFQATPILLDDALFFCTPRSRVVSLEAETGSERWVFDPEVDLSRRHYNLNCRGVAFWLDPAAAPEAHCRLGIYVATADARLIALDADTGTRCARFGTGGEVDFSTDVGPFKSGEYGISSPPVVVGDLIVLGSSVAENRRVDMPSGKVHAFDARSGELRWSWDPIPRDADDPARATWQGDSADRTGAANVWSLISADPERDLVFAPTSSPSPDFYGGERVGDNRHADSVVALRASTGERVWSFQTVHHNLWDYDLASQPVLIDWRRDGRTIPLVLQATKMGNLFILHRETGEPIFPVVERPVPQTTVPGEYTSPTQPFPSWPPPLAPQGLRPEEAWGLTPWDRGKCRDLIRSMRSEGLFTPPSFEGTVVLPGSGGGSNWGSVAYDPVRRRIIANTSNVATTIQLVPRDRADFQRDREAHVSRSEQEGTPYVARTGVLLSPFGVPCVAPPWGSLTALDLDTKKIAWRVTFGTTRDLAPLGIALPWGTPNMGGPIVTAGGLVFIGASLDDYLRAYDIETGEELWKGRLPAGGQATPMTYRVRDGGRQFVVIAAGGHNQMQTTRGDSVVAFALPETRSAAR
ncbi:MAG: pyrroloquinoline quinone-dependent dehydrogenase [Myxococcota bacterium]